MIAKTSDFHHPAFASLPEKFVTTFNGPFSFWCPSFPDIDNSKLRTDYWNAMLLQLISGVLDATDKTEFQDRIADLIEKCDGLTEHGRYLVASIVRRGFVRPRGRPSNRLRLWEISNRYFNRLGGPDRTRAEAISEISTRYNIGQEEATKLFSDARKQVGNPPMRVRGKPGPKPK